MRFDLRTAPKPRQGAAGRTTGRRFLRLGCFVGLLVLLVLVLSACDSNNTYPIDFFSEMHYMKSFRAQEPPRIDSPSSAIPFKGGNDVQLGGAIGPDAQMVRNPISASGTQIPLFTPNYSAAEAKNLKNPVPMNQQSLAEGAQLFSVNCVVCHGADGKGDGIAAALVFTANGKPKPANLTNPTLLSPTTNKPAQLTDGEIFWVITNGYGGYMPNFGNLLTPAERWALVDHIRQLEGK